MKHLGAWIRLWMMRMLILFAFLPFMFALTLSEIILPLNPELAHEIYGFIFSISNIYFHIPSQQELSISIFLNLIVKVGFFCLIVEMVPMWGWDYLLIYKFINGKSIGWYKVLPHPRFTEEFILDYTEWNSNSKFDMIIFFSFWIIGFALIHLMALVPGATYEQWIQWFINRIHPEDHVLSLTSIILAVLWFIVLFILMVSTVRFIRAILPLFKTPPQYVFPYYSYPAELMNKLCDKLSNSIGKKIKIKIGEYRYEALVFVLIILIAVICVWYVLVRIASIFIPLIP